MLLWLGAGGAPQGGCPEPCGCDCTLCPLPRGSLEAMHALSKRNKGPPPAEHLVLESTFPAEGLEMSGMSLAWNRWKKVLQVASVLLPRLGCTWTPPALPTWKRRPCQERWPAPRLTDRGGTLVLTGPGCRDSVAAIKCMIVLKTPASVPGPPRRTWQLRAANAEQPGGELLVRTGLRGIPQSKDLSKRQKINRVLGKKIKKKKRERERKRFVWQKLPWFCFKAAQRAEGAESCWLWRGSEAAPGERVRCPSTWAWGRSARPLQPYCWAPVSNSAGGFRDAGSPGFDTARGMGTCSVVVSNS
nr:uncharacterized protein LOC125184134 isoform X2 [Anser cygnoides]